MQSAADALWDAFAETAKKVLSQIPPPPPATGRSHPESDPGQPLRVESVQCQWCWKSKGPGVSLKKCAACRSELYCSPECQKKAWPSHKAKCKSNQLATASSIAETGSYHGYPNILEAVRAFTSKHRAGLGEAGMHALNLRTDPTRCLREVLLVTIVPRLAISNKVETNFFVAAVEVVSPAYFLDKEADIRELIKQANTSQKRGGQLSAFLAVLSCLDIEKRVTAMNAPAFGFSRALLDSMLTMPWEEWLIRNMNEGIIH